MKCNFKVTLANAGGELDSKTFEFEGCSVDADDFVDDMASALIETWILSIGDTITIREVS
jgi:hypothetical protein